MKLKPLKWKTRKCYYLGHKTSYFADTIFGELYVRLCGCKGDEWGFSLRGDCESFRCLKTKNEAIATAENWYSERIAPAFES